MRWRPVLVAFGAAVAVGLLGAAATNIGPWYYALHKPSWQPPDWLFGPAWTLIYALTALSCVLAWNAMASRTRRQRLLLTVAGNALLNVLWSELFFGLRRPDWALIEVVPFWLSILALLLAVWPASRAAGWLLMPYLLWVVFAGWLNLAIVRLNSPFGA